MTLPHSYDLLYDLKTEEQLQQEIDYLAERLAGIAELRREEGKSIDDYLLDKLRGRRDVEDPSAQDAGPGRAVSV